MIYCMLLSYIIVCILYIEIHPLEDLAIVESGSVRTKKQKKSAMLLEPLESQQNPLYISSHRVAGPI